MSQNAPDAYRLGRVLSADAVADLYEATHPRLPGRFAVQVLKPAAATAGEALGLFRRDVEVMAALRHPHVLQLLETATTTEGNPCFILELLEGPTLAQRLAGGKRLGAREVATIVTGLAGALHAAHRHGIIHGELRPDNVLLANVEGEGFGFPKILGFGSSWFRAWRGGAIGGIGTEAARYLAPEQAQGQLEEIDPQTDQFALGALAYRMLAGVDAFPGNDPVAVVYRVVHEEPRPLTEVAGATRAIDAAIRRALSKQRPDRFETALAFARALEQAVLEAAAEPRAVAPAAIAAPVVVEAPEVSVAGPIPAAAPPSAQRQEAWPALEDPFFDDDEEVERVPRARWRLPVFLLGTAAAGAAALWVFKPAPVWDALGLPRHGQAAVTAPAVPPPAADPAAGAPLGSYPTGPGPGVTGAPAQPGPGAETASQRVGAATESGVAGAAPAAAAGAAPSPSTPGAAAGAATPPAAAATPPAAAATPAAEGTASAPPTRANVEGRRSAARERTTTPPARERQGRATSSRRRPSEDDGDVVWSAREGRLVPASSMMVPAPAAPATPSAPAPAAPSAPAAPATPAPAAATAAPAPATDRPPAAATTPTPAAPAPSGPAASQAPSAGGSSLSPAPIAPPTTPRIEPVPLPGAAPAQTAP